MELDGLEQLSATEPSGKKCYGSYAETEVAKHRELLNPGKVAHTTSVVTHVCNRNPGEAETETPLGLTLQTAQMNLKVPGSERDPASKKKV